MEAVAVVLTAISHSASVKARLFERKQSIATEKKLQTLSYENKISKLSRVPIVDSVKLYSLLSTDVRKKGT